MAEDLVLLHGFAGTARLWDLVIEELGGERYRPLAIDMPNDSAQAAVDATLAAAPGQFALCGYSMGGRVALHAALQAPERVERLILVAATAGIEDSGELAKRRRADDRLIDQLRRWTIEEFADEWQKQPVFAGATAVQRQIWRDDILRNSTEELAQSLRSLSVAAMDSVWGRLNRLTMPVTVVAGARDTRYVELAQRLADAIPGADKPVIIEDAGHGLPREAPAQLARLIDGA